MPRKTPTKPSRASRPANTHLQCSAKRTLLKDRIRKLDTEQLVLADAVALQALRVDILQDVLKSVVETMGLEMILDPFGSGLNHEEDEGKTSNSPPS